MDLVKRVRAKFSKNCAFCATSVLFTVRFHFGIRTSIRYGTISEMDVLDISYVLLLNFITVRNMKFHVYLHQKEYTGFVQNLNVLKCP